MKTILILMIALSSRKSVTCTDQNGNVIAHKCSVNQTEMKAFIKSVKPSGPVTDEMPMLIFTTYKVHPKCKR